MVGVTQETGEDKMKKVKTTDVRNALYNVMTGVLDGTVEIKKAQQATKAASQITCSVRADLEKERLALKAKRASTKLRQVEI